ncbi:YcxB family protein [Flavonifractor sp. HCP28S3_F3]|uniref:YcxB family protein n=1 Tax=Flavonifractor sp. HCP28S3_F3 TaxID=3438939 RepID=UPI003F89137C
MNFEMETVYDKQTIQAFQNILNQTLRAKRIQFARLTFMITGCVCIGYGFLWLWAKSQADISVIPAVSSFAAGIPLLLLGLFYKKYRNRSVKHMVNQTPERIYYSFDENGYFSRSGSTKLRSTYHILEFMFETDHYFVLMLSRKKGFILDKSRFQFGTPEEFRSFLSQKTGKQMMLVS